MQCLRKRSDSYPELTDENLVFMRKLPSFTVALLGTAKIRLDQFRFY